MSEVSPEKGVRHCHADGYGPCLASDCPIAGLGPLLGHLRPCPGVNGPQHPAPLTPPDHGCANYAAPVTCLIAPSSMTGRCDHCKEQA